MADKNKKTIKQSNRDGELVTESSDGDMRMISAKGVGTYLDVQYGLTTMTFDAREARRLFRVLKKHYDARD